MRVPLPAGDNVESIIRQYSLSLIRITIVVITQVITMTGTAFLFTLFVSSSETSTNREAARLKFE